MPGKKVRVKRPAKAKTFAAGDREKSEKKKTPLRPTGRGTGIRYKGINDSKHKDIDATEKKMMESSIVEEILRFSQVLFPNVALGFDPSEVLAALKKDGTYDPETKNWKEWPEVLEPGQEEEINRFLEKIFKAIDDALRRLAEGKPDSPAQTDVNAATDSSKFLDTNSAPPLTPSSAPHPSTNLSEPPSLEGSSTPNSYPQRLRKVSCSTRNKGPAGETAVRKPDHVFLKMLLQLAGIHWEDIDALLELKYADSKKAQFAAKNEIWQYAKFIFRNQHNRRFVLGVSLLGTTMTIMYVDRSGVLIGTSFDIREEPLEFLRVIAGIVYADDKYLGYDTSISMGKGGGHVSLHGKEYTIEHVVHAESGILGRGTVCFKATNGESNPSALKIFAIKESWVDVSRTQKEAGTLEVLNRLKIKNIPKLVDSGIVQVDGVNDSTQTVRDVITEIAKSLPEKDRPSDLPIGAHEGVEAKQAHAEEKNENDKRLEAAVPVQAPGKPEDKKLNAKKWKINWTKYFARDHYRLVLWPFGRPLTHFRCLEELLLGIRDIIGVVEQLEKNRFLHRDISINNVVLADKDEDEDGNPIPKELRKRLEGFLIDFDYSINIDREDPSALADRTGTVPFMAIEVLQSHQLAKQHKYYHDLESVFYVLIWVCTVSGGPGIPRPIAEFRNSTVYGWNDRDPSVKGMEEVACSKSWYTQNDTNMEILMANFHEYFEPIRKCILGFRNCLFPNPLDEFMTGHVNGVIDRLTGTTDPKELKDLKIWRLRLPPKDRVVCTLFEDLYEVIDNAVEALPREHRLGVLSGAEEDHEVEYEEELISNDICTSNGESQFMIPLKNRSDVAPDDDEDEGRDVLGPFPSFKPSLCDRPDDVSSVQKERGRKRKQTDEDHEEGEPEASSSSSNKKLCEDNEDTMFLSDPLGYCYDGRFPTSSSGASCESQ